MTAENSPDANDLVKQAIQIAIPSTWEPDYIAEQEPEDLELETLGLLISRFTQWSGDSILKVAIAALEDANFHTEAGELREMLERLE